MTNTYGEFFGQTLSFAECEILAVATIDRKILSAEAALYGDKWFDYRPLHPTMATYLCAHHYNRAYGDFMGECMAHGKRFMVGFKGKDVMKVREKKSFWKLRQKVDSLGIRYDFFMREAMQVCIARGWRRPPRPAHILNDNELLLEVANKWSMECRAKIQFALSPRFLVENFVGAPDQLAYEEYLVSEIMRRPHPKYALHGAMYLYGTLRIETALARLPASAIEGAFLHCQTMISQN